MKWLKLEHEKFVLYYTEELRSFGVCKITAVVIHAVKKAIYHGDSSLKKSWLKEVKVASYFIKKRKKTLGH